MEKKFKSNINIFVDILQYDNLYSKASKNNLTINSYEDNFSKNIFKHMNEKKKI